MGAKLTEAQVKGLKQRLAEGEQDYQGLANEYQVSKSTIQAIKQGRNWSWLSL